MRWGAQIVFACACALLAVACEDHGPTAPPAPTSTGTRANGIGVPSGTVTGGAGAAGMNGNDGNDGGSGGNGGNVINDPNGTPDSGANAGTGTNVLPDASTEGLLPSGLPGMPAGDSGA
jgi:hypothetical protein